MKMFLELHTLNLALSEGGWSTSDCFATRERDRTDTRVGLGSGMNVTLARDQILSSS
jgi:hypothetical protein